MFNKIAAFTDIHFGLKGNSRVHNNDCEEFVDWFIDQSTSHGCDTGIFLGDWHHNRDTLNLSTMNYTIRCLEKLGKAFDNFFIFPGNHDLYYKDKRSVKSTEFARHIPGVTVVNEIYENNNVALIPWLVNDEWKTLGNIKSQYVFGHFELPNFFMNAMVKMPDKGELKAEHFVNQLYVFSGHFHKRQTSSNVHYIGNAFPHNYADAWDDDRGMMILDKQNNKEPMYLNWAACPKYRTIKLSDLIDNKDTVIKDKMYLKIELDIDVSYEELSFIKETFLNEHKCREVIIDGGNGDQEDIESDLDIKQFKSVDEVVANEILSIESSSYDTAKLLEIYEGL